MKLPGRWSNYKCWKHLFFHRGVIFVNAWLDIVDSVICICTLTLYNPWWGFKWHIYATKKELDYLAKLGYPEETC